MGPNHRPQKIYILTFFQAFCFKVSGFSLVKNWTTDIIEC